jgi:hypothetical protein
VFIWFRQGADLRSYFTGWHSTYVAARLCPGFWTAYGVTTLDRHLHFVQDASRASLKWSRGVLLTITFSAEHLGQVNRITYPVLVPGTSGFWKFFVICIFIFKDCLISVRPASPMEMRQHVQEGFC